MWRFLFPAPAKKGGSGFTKLGKPLQIVQPPNYPSPITPGGARATPPLQEKIQDSRLDDTII